MSTYFEQPIEIAEIEWDGIVTKLKNPIKTTARYEKGYWSISCPDLEIFCVSSTIEDAKRQFEEEFAVGMNNYYSQERPAVKRPKNAEYETFRMRYAFYVDGKKGQEDEAIPAAPVFTEEFMIQVQFVDGGDWYNYAGYTDKTKAFAGLRMVQKENFAPKQRIMVRKVSEWEEYL